MNSRDRVRSFAVLGLSGLLLFAAGCNNGTTAPSPPDQSAVPYSQTDLTPGTGTEAAAGTTATVQYGGWYYSDTAADHKGQQFDAGTFSFLVGGGTIIKGFDMGVTGMKVGGIRRLIIPPSLAYGPNGNGSTIPPNAALVFDVLLGNVQ